MNNFYTLITNVVPWTKRKIRPYWQSKTLDEVLMDALCDENNIRIIITTPFSYE